MWLAVLIPYTSRARSSFGFLRSSLDLWLSQGRLENETFDSQAESPLLPKAPYVTGGIWG